MNSHVVGYEITCANRDTSGGLLRVGGEGWTLSTHEAIVKLISQQLRLNIVVDGQFMDVGIRGEGFNAYLVTEPDGVPLHNLISLPSCKA
jgi:uncharacterized protein DUF3892